MTNLAPIGSQVSPGAKKASEGKIVDSRQWNLVLRCALINVLIMVLFEALYIEGLFDSVFAFNMLTKAALLGMCFVGLGGLTWCARKIVVVTRELNCLRYLQQHETEDVSLTPSVKAYLDDIQGCDALSRSNIAQAWDKKFYGRLMWTRFIRNALVLLGLIGTVAGFIVAFGGIDPDKVRDINNIAPMVSALIQGMRIALYTTLVGSVISLWLGINHRLLTEGLLDLYPELIIMGERRCKEVENNV